MALSRVLYLGDASTVRFTIPFPYLEQSDVRVFVNKVEQMRPLDWDFDGDSVAVLVTAPADKDAVEIIRTTESDVALSQFQDGSILTEAELNLAILQNLYLNQELRDYMDALLDPAVNNIASNLGVIPTTAEETINAVVQSILTSQELADLQQHVTDIDTNAAQISDLYTTTTGISANITSEQTTRADEDSALAARIDTVQSNVDSNHALIATEQTTRADGDSALSDRIDAVLATANNNTALITTEQTARADGDSANASAISTLQTKVDGNTASIQTVQTVQDGIKAEYMVKLDVNGYVSGFGLYNQASSSQFLILADKFAVVTPGNTPIVPFAVDANGVYMNNAYIRNLAVDKITGGAIKAFWSLSDATGRIVLDTGTYMKVMGAGFGLNGDLIEWFGPKMDVGSCTRANGITWVATDGSAYFGGSLSAGTLYNARSGGSTQVDASLILGPYATNGGVKTVVLSYAYSNNQAFAGTGGSGSGPTSATVDLYRTIDGQAETKIGTLTASGSWLKDPDNDSVSISGSWTYTDADPGTADRTYRAVITSRDTGISINLANEKQTLTLISTEQ